ncbi:MAG TPA: winged helix DNA-binding domain-containing protein [Thermomicrobiales bacterium]|nr:winged helix DNA-binding domain-containing protein [Thermomicrobiales bacterium]
MIDPNQSDSPGDSIEETADQMPRVLNPSATMLTTRELNRATLARQALIERSDLTPFAMVEHLVGMQAQAPNPPYIGLWTRLGNFNPDDLSGLILDRSIVRIALMRSTVHMVTAEDALLLSPLTRSIAEAHLSQKSFHTEAIAGVDLARLKEIARDLLEQRPRTLNELRPLLGEHFPDSDTEQLAWAVRLLLPLVQVPPRGIWGTGGLPICTTLGSWLGRDLHPEPAIDGIVLRYLRAFGPASVRDAQVWMGLTRLGDVFARLRPQLVSFVNDAGVELFDLPDASRPDAETPVRPRILPAWDNVLISYADRRRMISEEFRPRVFSQNGIIQSTLLVDGFVAGVVTMKRLKKTASVEIELLTTISPDDRELAAIEAHALLAFAEPNAETHEVRFTSAI